MGKADKSMKAFLEIPEIFLPVRLDFITIPQN